MYARNQRRKASQKNHQLEPDRSGLGSNARPTGTTGWRTPWLGDVAGREATVKDCGVAMARLQGHSWAPTPSKGSGVNVGTTWSVPAVMAGKTCRRSTLAKWGGGPVVVRARESRVHGEGVQCVCSAQARGGGLASDNQALVPAWRPAWSWKKHGANGTVGENSSRGAK